MTPPMPSISSMPLALATASREKFTSASKSMARFSRRAAMSGDSGAAKRQGAMRSISAGVTGGRARRAARRDRSPRRCRIEAGHDRLQRIDGPAGGAPMPDQAGGNKGLADVGAGRGDEDRAHVLRRMRVRTMSASRAISASGWAALKRQPQPRGALRHGRRTDRDREIAFGFEQLRGSERRRASPITTGTIALCACGRPAARGEGLCLGQRQRQPWRGSRSIRSIAAMAAATIAGGRPVE